MTSRAPSRRVFGLETEYALTAQGGQMDAEQRARVLFEPINRRYNSTNVFLPSGGRLYLDVGSHPEYATAECDRLEDLLIQERYGDQLVQSLVGQANERLEGQNCTSLKITATRPVMVMVATKTICWRAAITIGARPVACCPSWLPAN